MVKKILICDSQPIAGYGLLSLIGTLDCTFNSLNLVSDFKKTINYLDIYAPQLLIIDASVFDEKGVGIIKEIKLINKFLKILVTNQSYNSSLAIQSIRFGASGFVSKKESLETIKRALIRIVEGGIFMCDQLNDELSKPYCDKSTNGAI